jgi:deferrochelatase/peroxidase EfeB
MGWRSSREQQEALVGRDKLSGCPIAAINVDQTGTIAITRSGCPLNTRLVSDQVGPTQHAIQPRSADPLVQTSHIYRANRTRQPLATDGSHLPAGLRVCRFFHWAAVCASV